MKPLVRQAAIQDYVEANYQASVEQLSALFQLSAETIRRDLSSLAASGKIRKIHGGAVRNSPVLEDKFVERERQNSQAKKSIAVKLCELIKPGQTIMMDTGSTTLACAERMAKIDNLMVITNSARIAQVVSQNNSSQNTILLGGYYHCDNQQTIGSHTCAEINQYRVDHAVITVSAIDDSAIYDFSLDEAHVAKAMIKVSQSVIVVADHSKFNYNSINRVCDLSELTALVVDVEPPKSLSSALFNAGIAVYQS